MFQAWGQGYHAGPTFAVYTIVSGETTKNTCPSMFFGCSIFVKDKPKRVDYERDFNGFRFDYRQRDSDRRLQERVAMKRAKRTNWLENSCHLRYFGTRSRP